MSKHRNPELAKIHIAKKDLGLSDEEYRDVISSVAPGKTSSAKLNTKERLALLERFGELGFKGKSKPKRRSRKQTPSYPGRPQNMDRGGSRANYMSKIEAYLAQRGLPWSYADSMAKRICRNADGQPIERVALCPPDQLRKLVAAFEYHVNRKKWRKEEARPELAGDHACAVCDRRGPWNDGWQWFGSLNAYDENRTVVKACSTACQKTAKGNLDGYYEKAAERAWDEEDQLP